MSLGSRALQSRFLKWGFLGTEAEEFGNNFSFDAIRNTPYLRAMIRDRQLILANARQYNWSIDRIINAIRLSYRRKGLSGNIRDKSNIWAFFRWYNENQIPLTGRKYETPRPKMRTRLTGRTSPKEKKRQMILDEITLLKRNIAVLKDEGTKDLYRKRIDVLRRQLDNMAQSND